MATEQQYDAIVIGSGQAGTPLSMALADAGMRTAGKAALHGLARRRLRPSTLAESLNNLFTALDAA